MALPNLSGSNIQDTFQRLIHTDGSEFYNGTGSIVNLVTNTQLNASSSTINTSISGKLDKSETGSFAVLGSNVEFNELTAQKYIVSSSVTYLTQSFSSGSTQFGDSGDDSHRFIGKITASGFVSNSGTIMGAALIAREYLEIGNVYGNRIDAPNNSQIDINLGSGGAVVAKLNVYSNLVRTTTPLLVLGEIKTTNNVVAAANISASGNLYGTDLFINNKNYVDYHSGDDIFRVSADGTPVKFFTSIEATNITASGDISASGALSGSGFTSPIANGASIRASDGSIKFNSNTEDRIYFDGTNIVIGVDDSDSLQIKDSHVDVGGTLKVTSHITASGNISASGTVVGSNISGTNTGDQDLSSYSTITQLNASSSTLQSNISSNASNISSKAPLASPTFTGTLGAAAISASGHIQAQSYTVNGVSGIFFTTASSVLTLGADGQVNKIILGKGNNPDVNIFTKGHFTASGNISSSGTIVASNISGTNTGDQDLSSYSTITNLNASSSTLNTTIGNKLDKTETGSFALTLNLNTKLDKTETGSFALTSNVVANSATSSFLTSTPEGTYSSSLQTLGNITASGNISSSGRVTSKFATVTNTLKTSMIATPTSSNDSFMITDYNDAAFIHFKNNIEDANFILTLGDYEVNGNGARIIINDDQNLVSVKDASFTAHIISASNTIVGSNLSGTNTGDQDLSSYSTITQLNASSSTLNTTIGNKLDKTETGSFALTTNLNTKLDKTETGSFALTTNLNTKLDKTETESL